MALKHGFWGKSKFYCPHCKKTFSFLEMWKNIVDEYGNVDDIMALLNSSCLSVKACLINHKLRLDPHKSNKDLGVDVGGRSWVDIWEKKAKKYGYRNAHELFYDLRVVKLYNHTVIAGLVGADRGQVKAGIKYYLEGRRQKKD